MVVGRGIGAFERAVRTVIESNWGRRLRGVSRVRPVLQQMLFESLEERRLLSISTAIYGPYSIDEGSTATFTLSASASNYIAGWSVDFGDGALPQWIESGQSGSDNRYVEHGYSDGNSSYSVTATAYESNDQRSNYGANDSYDDSTYGLASIYVQDVPMTVQFNAGGSTDEGAVYDVSLNVSDPGDDQVTQWTVDFGDGGSDTYQGGPAALHHIYPDGPNSYTVSASVHEDDGNTFNTSWTVTVNNVAPDFNLAGADHVAEGSTYSVHHVYNDPGEDTISGWTIDWGDGTGSDSISGNSSDEFTHVYADGPDEFDATFMAFDEDGQYTFTKHVIVENVDPEPTLGGVDWTAPNSYYTVSADGGVDPGDDTPVSWTIDWGDGSSPQTFNVGNRDLKTFSHYYSSENIYTIQAMMTDEDGSFSAPAERVIVSTSPPSPSIGGN